MIGSQLGNFELIDELGGGAWGRVYRARQVNLGGRLVAVKVLHPALARDETARQRFVDEANHMAQLRHSNIVKVHDVGEEDGTYYFAMEYIEGNSLSEVIAREGSMSAGRVAEMGAQIADALGRAHSRGVVHRDIKPGNILLDAEGRPVLTDFGIAKVGEGTGLTATGMSIGTPEYMSPEQAKGNIIDGRSDIYSLGVVLYEMLCGQAPFTAATPVAVGMKHISEPPQDPRELRPDCPEWLASIILRALAKEPFDRFGTAQEMAATLRAARPVVAQTMEMPTRSYTGGAVATPDRQTSQALTAPVVSSQPARTTRHWVVAAVVFGIVLILGLMLGIGVLISSRAPVTPPLPPPEASRGGGPGLPPLRAPQPQRIAPLTAIASSVLNNEPKYWTANAVDGRRDTAWAEGAPGNGEGEWLEIRLPGTYQLTRVELIPGFDKVRADAYGDRWTLNNRVTAARLEFDHGSSTHVNFDANLRDFQGVNLRPPIRTQSVRITITGTKRGTKQDWHDACVSEVRLYGYHMP